MQVVGCKETLVHKTFFQFYYKLVGVTVTNEGVASLLQPTPTAIVGAGC